MGTTNGHGSTPNKEVPVERSLECKLNEKELLERGDRMAEAELEIEALKLKRSEFTRAINTQGSKRAALAHAIDAGIETRLVTCKWIQDFEHNVWRLIRQDTGVEVENRTMTSGDRQEALNFESVDVAGTKVDFGKAGKANTKSAGKKAPKVPAQTPVVSKAKTKSKVTPIKSAKNKPSRSKSSHVNA